MGRYFGTDGFRGEAGAALTASHAYKTGLFFGTWCRSSREKKPRVLIGKDTRLSSDMLESAIASGLMASGAEVFLLKAVTTPALAFLTKQEAFDGGVMISASHNVYSDNGIKLFGADGCKISDALCEKIEDYIDGICEFESASLPLARGEGIGTSHSFSQKAYEKFLTDAASTRFDGLRVALDCANGSTSHVAERVFSALGATVSTINASPDGKNINRDCGSTHIRALSEFVRRGNFDAGFAFDGDGDRCIAVDPLGRELSGDVLMFLLSKYFRSRSELSGGAIAVTVMSNLGLHIALEREGIRCVQSAVGDRYVLENMQKYSLSLGGEQSGHIIMKNYLHTGDGILTAIKSLEAARALKLSFDEVRDSLSVLPQTLVNVRVRDKRIADADSVADEADRIRSELSGHGRVLLRPSGTEQIVRIRVEAQTKEECERHAKALADAIARAEGGAGI